MESFLQELKQGQDSLQLLQIEENLEEMTHYNLKINNIRTTQTPEGKYLSEVSYTAKKLKTEQYGSILEIPMSEKITIPALKDHLLNEEIILETKVGIHSGEGIFYIESATKPYWIGLDPWGTRLDPNRNDNFFPLKSSLD